MRIDSSIPFVTVFLSLFLLFSCSNDDDAAATFDTQTDISEVTQVTALVTVEVVGDLPPNVESKGLVWGTNSNPTQDDNQVELTGGAAFNATLDYLEAGTTYYVRPYIVNNTGLVYGEEKSFTTTEHLVYTGKLFFNSQQEVNDFGAQGYTKVVGGLSFYNPVVNVEALSSLLEITDGGLNFYETNCSSLQGLHNLRRVGGIVFSRNFQLTSMQGLEKIKTLKNGLYMEQNGFVNFNGLNNLEYIGKPADPEIFVGFRVFNEDNLVNFEGLESLQLVEGIFYVQDCQALENFAGLDNLRRLPDGFWVWTCSPTDFVGLGSLEFTARLSVKFSGIENFEGLNSLAYVQDLSLEGNSQLVNFRGLESLTAVERLMVVNDSDNLVSTDGLENLAQMGVLNFVNNDVLVDYCALLNLFNTDPQFPFITINNAYNPYRKLMLNGECSI